MESSCIDHGRKGDKNGYCRDKIPGGGGRLGYRHRLVYCKAHGMTYDEFPAGMVVRHTCDNARCVNPDHLIIGTHKDNMRDMTERKRSASRTRHGNNVLTEADVLWIRKHYKAGDREFGQYALARQFNVSRFCIHAIVTGKTWKE